MEPFPEAVLCRGQLAVAVVAAPQKLPAKCPFCACDRRIPLGNYAIGEVSMELIPEAVLEKEQLAVAGMTVQQPLHASRSGRE